MKTSGSSRDSLFYVLAALCGIGAGVADVAVNDLLFTALLVLASCMLLGCCARGGRAVGRGGWNLHSADRRGCLFCADGEADAGTGV